MSRPITHFNYILSKEDLFWMVGLLEGEGCFAWSKSGRKMWPKITIDMTDEDVIVRFSSLIERKYFPRPAKPPNKKAHYVCAIAGTPAAELMNILLPHMGVRRQKKIREILVKFNAPIG